VIIKALKVIIKALKVIIFGRVYSTPTQSQQGVSPDQPIDPRLPLQDSDHDLEHSARNLAIAPLDSAIANLVGCVP
jgi:hypothetical protein